ncbi:uncharacterized protein B0T15DRAFT_494761 [Chaetomium strumarium]|uniref:Uncharacterized protein n=1 Tax=Chaetomium strumarium TaxID=1170767 RepID=A0AAJ0M0B4_9PEZI|nr:hypothetical protein B0T15DRAFT_494761 [Chaetomium strumarium]
MSMLVYNVKGFKTERLDKHSRPTEYWAVIAEGQVWPCGPRETDLYNKKRPSCQEVLDKMNIYWRFGNIPAKEPTPEPQLPPLPPGYYGGGGGGSGYHPGYASGPVQPTSYGSNPFTSDAVAGLGLAYTRKGVAYNAAKRGKTPVPLNRTSSSKPSTKADPPGSRNARPPNTNPASSLSDSLGRLSLKDKGHKGAGAPVQQPRDYAVRAYGYHAQPQGTAGPGIGGRDIMKVKPPGSVSSTATGTKDSWHGQEATPHGFGFAGRPGWPGSGRSSQQK